MKYTRILALTCNLSLLLGLSFALGVHAQNSPAIQQLFGFACGSANNVCPNGASPNSLLQSADRNFYGTTASGGTGNQAAGTVFKITPTGQLSTLFTFVADENGEYPNGGGPTSLVEGDDGFLYGTTAGGGVYGNGAVFKLSRIGTIQVLHSFCPPTNCGDGFSPSNLVLGRDGNAYGGTFGSNGLGGTLFRVTPRGSYTLLHTFNPRVEGPMAIGLTLASDGNVYGTAVGAEDLLTTLFRLTPSGQFTVLQTIRYGQFFVSAPIQASDGKLYGGLSRFEDQAEPAIFASNVSGSNFTNILLPSFVFIDYVRYMTPASDSNLWSIISGNSLDPEVVSLSPNGKLLKTARFDGTNGANPDAALVQSSDGTLLGVTESGGTVQQGDVASGVIFTLNAGLAAPKPLFVSFSPSRGAAGSKVMIHGVHLIGTTHIAFNGLSATFRVLNTANITATVPLGATTGPIAVTNAGGTTVSKTNFTVN